jgi:uncharacterized cupredoxin-like copper-binding protein
MRLTGSRRAAAVGALAFVLAVAAYGVVAVVQSGGASGDALPRVLGPGPATVRLVVRDSHFAPSRIHVRPHTELTFEVVNRDFINHEFIIGGDDVHVRHENGHEPYHPPVPGEVSIAPHETGVTTYTVHAPGKVLFACHLPGHFAYGMKGTVIVDPA